MNEENILLLSHVLEILFLLSIVFAILALWMSRRAKRERRLKDEPLAASRRRGILDDHKPE